MSVAANKRDLTIRTMVAQLPAINQRYQNS